MAYILLTSAMQDVASTRSFNDFSTKDEVAKTLIEYYEGYLLTKQSDKRFSGTEGALEYSSDQLYDFLTTFFHELCVLERDEDDPSLWTPRETMWVLEKCVFNYLRTTTDPKMIAGKHEAIAQATAQPQPFSFLGSNNMDIDDFR